MTNPASDPAQDLLYLVCCAVNGNTPDRERCAQMDLRAVYGLSLIHFLGAAAAFALEQVMELPHPFDQVKKKAIRKLALFDIEREKVLRALEREGVWHMPLKGVTVRDCYPKAAMREMSDNDILCDGDKMDTVKAVMEELGYTCESFGESNHDEYSKPPTLEFEMHGALFSEKEMPLFASYYKNVTDRLVKDEGRELAYHMTNEDNYIYLLCHMYKHYLYKGTGLRALLDIYLFNKKHGDELNRDKIAAELKKLKLDGFEKKTRSFSEKVFTGQPLSEEERKELDSFINNGIYGTARNYKEYMLYKSIGVEKKEKRRFLLRRIFPRDEYLQKNYPFVARHKALYPLLILYRPIKGMAKHPKTILGEYRDVKKIKEPKRYLDE